MNFWRYSRQHQKDAEEINCFAWQFEVENLKEGREACGTKSGMACNLFLAKTFKWKFFRYSSSTALNINATVLLSFGNLKCKNTA